MATFNASSKKCWRLAQKVPDAAQNTTNLARFPSELLLAIFAFLTHSSLTNCAFVCSRFREIAGDSKFFRSLEITDENTRKRADATQRLRWLLGCATDPTKFKCTFRSFNRNSELVVEKLRSWRNLEELNLSRVSFRGGLPEGRSLDLERLSVLRLHQCDLRRNQLFELVERNKSLRVLQLSFLDTQMVPNLRALTNLEVLELQFGDCRRLEDLPLQGLKFLQLCSCILTLEMLANIFERNTGLTYFDLIGNNHIHWVPLDIVGSALEHLYLELPRDGFDALRQIAGFTKLKTLALRNVTFLKRLTDRNKVFQLQYALREIAQHCHTLETLQLECIYYVNDGVLSSFFANCPNLVNMWLVGLPRISRMVCLRAVRQVEQLRSFAVVNCERVKPVMEGRLRREFRRTWGTELDVFVGLSEQHLYPLRRNFR